MSEARMCDRCGQMFSLNEDGFETYQATRVTRDDRGRRVTESYMADSCPACSAVNSPLARNRELSPGPYAPEPRKTTD